MDVKKQQSGFTLIELLVVIAIISTLASIILVSVENVRSRARDTQRKAALNQIRIALELYRNDHGTFQVNGAGWQGGGQGWLSYENGVNHSTAITRVLYNEGYLPQPIIDDPTTVPGYIIYTCNGGQSYALSATLENPTPAEIATAASSCQSNYSVGLYGKNFVLENK